VIRDTLPAFPAPTRACLKSIDEQVQCGREALRRMTEMGERREASGVRRLAEYSWVDSSRRAG